jgi:cell wall-associated NlpC family hydrolase
MLEQYIGLKHEYGKLDCITLIQRFYAEQLNIELQLPYYEKSKKWMYVLSAQSVNDWALKYAIKTTLTSAQNYDLIVFKSEKQSLITHFGMFLLPNTMLHIEEKAFSTITTLSEYWVSSIYAIYRHEQLV